MNRERGWQWVVIVGAAVIAISLASAFQSMRDPAPALNAHDRRALYESNLRNFTESCEVKAGHEDNPGMRDFCRTQAHLLQLLSECDGDCQTRTATFTRADPSK